MRTALALSMIAASSLLMTEPVLAERVFQARTAEATVLPTTKDQIAVVLQVAIPAGRWVIQSKTQAVNFGLGDVVRCGLYKGATILDGSGTHVGSGGNLPFVAMLVNQALTRTTTTSIIALRCNHTERDLAGIYLDPGSSLIIEEVAP